ncbi:MAG TPA: hypothetical protein VNQ79_21565 [Blastocatellia bacterium]|nr:hypothetical protein [Blastocatellia bacterium]
MNVRLMLDASGENDCPADFLAVASETEFWRADGSAPLFVRGDRLCHWARELCRVRGLKEGPDFVELPSPRNRLRLLIGNRADEVQPNVLTRAVDLLNRHQGLTCGELLARLTGDDFWAEAPSREHAARWLLAPVSAELTPLVKAACKQWARNCTSEALRRLYQLAPDERQSALKEWLSVDDDTIGPGCFPLTVEGEAAAMLREWWGQKLRQTNGQALAAFSAKHPNARLLAAEAYDYFRHRWQDLTSGAVARIGPLLSPAQRSELERLVPRDIPEPLDPGAGEQEAITWAVQCYLPYREWQVSTALAEESETQAAEAAAGSFADWLLENYPRLTTRSYEDSPLNLRGRYIVSELLSSSRVLWVVVDGLNYPNHRRLLQLLAQTDAALSVEQDYTLLAVLPTITRQAKYGLTSGLLPGRNVKNEWNISKVLADSFPQAKYAGVDQVDRLRAWLADENVRLCYWNMTAVDDCYHRQKDIVAIQNNVGAQLDALARIISQLVTTAANPEQVAVVISTDHGQMLGPCLKHPDKLNDIHGRYAPRDQLKLSGDSDCAYVRASDNSAVLLNPTRFQISEAATIALRSYYFGGWPPDSQGRAWGVHGGLYPEEVVVGFSVLRRRHQRRPVTAAVTGTGEAGRPGRVTLWIDNPNPAPLRLLTLTLSEVNEYRAESPLDREVAGLSHMPVELETEKFPASGSEEQLKLTGILAYEFSDGVRHECVVTGTLTSKQIYSGQRPSLRDRFKR